MVKGLKRRIRRLQNIIILSTIIIAAGLFSLNIWTVIHHEKHIEARSCPFGLHHYRRIELIFGDIPKAEWDKFLNIYVDPYFDGYNIKVSEGRWKGVSEGSFEIQFIYTEPDDKIEDRLSIIRAKYKKLFHQESVLLESFPVCAEF